MIETIAIMASSSVSKKGLLKQGHGAPKGVCKHKLSAGYSVKQTMACPQMPGASLSSRRKTRYTSIDILSVKPCSTSAKMDIEI